MKDNISEETKGVVKNFRKLSEINKLYFTAVILNHLSNGLINEGNYSDSDTAYEEDKLVLEPSFIGLDNAMDLATRLLLLASDKNKVTINPNGIDIEPYVKDMENIKPMLSMFYKLEYESKIDFLAEIMYDISEIDDIQKIDFNFSELIKNILDYHNETFGRRENNSIEIE